MSSTNRTKGNASSSQEGVEIAEDVARKTLGKYTGIKTIQKFSNSSSNEELSGVKQKRVEISEKAPKRPTSQQPLKSAVKKTVNDSASDSPHLRVKARGRQSSSSSSNSSQTESSLETPAYNKKSKSSMVARDRSERSKNSSKPKPFNMDELDEMENEKLSKVVTGELVKQVTKSMNEVNFVGFETRIKKMILQLIQKPVQKMALQEELVQKYGTVTRKNVRRLHEMEYIIQRFQKVIDQADQFDNRFNKLEAKLQQQSTHYDWEIRQLNHKLTDEVATSFAENKRELESWKRWFVRIQREVEDMRSKQQNDSQLMMNNLRKHIKQSHEKLEKFQQTQTKLTHDGDVLKLQMNQQLEESTKINVQQQVMENEQRRQQESFETRMKSLTKRIEKAEADRMDKYYKQVGLIQDWMHQVKDQVTDSYKMTEGLSVYFSIEHQINIYNQISEVMCKTLEGRQLNNFLEFMRARQDQIGKKKLSMLNNSFKDQLFISTRYLGNKQAFWPLPGKIPDDELPPDFNEILSALTKQMQEMQQNERRAIKEEQEAQRRRLLGQNSGLDNSSKESLKRKQTKRDKKPPISVKSSKKMESGSVGLLLTSQSQGGKSSNKDGKSSNKEDGKADSVLRKTAHVKFGSLSISSGSQDQKDNANNKREPTEPSNKQPSQKDNNSSQPGINSTVKSSILTSPQRELNGSIKVSEEQNEEEKKQIKPPVMKKRSGTLTKLYVQGSTESEMVKTEQDQSKKQTKMDKVFEKITKDDKSISVTVQELSKTKQSKNRHTLNDGGDKNRLGIMTVHSQPNVRGSPVRSEIQESSSTSQSIARISRHKEDKNGNFKGKKRAGQSSSLSSQSQLTSSSDSSKLSKRSNVKAGIQIVSARGKLKISLVDPNEKKKLKKQGTKSSIQSRKKKQQRSSSSSSSSCVATSEEEEQKSRKQKSSSSRGRFGRKHEDWARGVMEDLREEWQEADRNTYVQKKDFDPEQVQDIDKKANSIYDLLLKHESQTASQQKETIEGIDEMRKMQADLKKQFQEGEERINQQKKELDEQIQVLEGRYNDKLRQQFNDFLLKIEGELTRRNRLRIETFSKLDDHEESLKRMNNTIDRFDKNQREILGTIKKLMYTNDIQTSLNIQNELDREWVSLFGALDPRTGGNTVQPGKDIDPQRSIFTINKDCMSCTGNAEAKLNLFKIACINYQPNPVTYQNKLINRHELVSLQKVISDLAKQSIESTQVLNPERNIMNISQQNRDSESSPERTNIEEILVTPDEQESQADGPVEISHKVSQLTQAGIAKVRGLLGELKFKDQDLEEITVLRDRSDIIKTSFFGRQGRAGSNQSSRKTSAYKRKLMNNRFVQSQVTNYLNTTMHSNFGKSKQIGVEEQLKSIDSENENQSTYSKTIQKKKSSSLAAELRRSYNTQNDGRKTQIVIPVVKVGTQIYPTATDNKPNDFPSYLGSTVMHGLPQTTQVQLLNKSRQSKMLPGQVQPISASNQRPMGSAQFKNRPSSKQQIVRSRGASQVFASAEHLDSQRAGDQMAQNHLGLYQDDSLANLNSTQVSQKVGGGGSRFSSSALAHHQSHHQHYQSTAIVSHQITNTDGSSSHQQYNNSRVPTKGKTSIVVPMKSKSGQGGSSRRHMEPKVETVESESHNRIVHDGLEASSEESIIKVTMPKVFDYNHAD